MVIDQRDRGAMTPGGGTTIAIKSLLDAVDRVAANRECSSLERYGIDILRRVITKPDLQEPFRSQWANEGLRLLGLERIPVTHLFSPDEIVKGLVKVRFDNMYVLAKEVPTLGAAILNPNYIVIK